MSQCFKTYIYHDHDSTKSFDSLPGPINQPPSLYRNAYLNLLSCNDCVQVYHTLIMSIDKEDIIFAKEVHLKTVSRLTGHIRSCLEKSTVQNCSTSLKEILRYPKLLLNEKLSCVFVTCIKSISSSGVHSRGLAAGDEFQINEKLPGLYLLLVHPDNEVIY